ncbi:MAG TPA: hypothetical protein VJJ81_02765 [Candidatus Babeliales bacterium]|nr:hypothetical protein [Candidatus Babeliales bacterium]
MKIGSVISFMIIIQLSCNLVAQQVDCDELAKYVQEKARGIYPRAGIDRYWGGDLIVTARCSREWCYRLPAYSCSPKEDERSEKTRPSYIVELSATLSQFEKLENALKRCSRAANKSSPLAEDVVHEIQAQKELTLKCTSVYEQTIKDHQARRQARNAERDAAIEKHRIEEKRFDDYIKVSK